MTAGDVFQTISIDIEGHLFFVHHIQYHACPEITLRSVRLIRHFHFLHAETPYRNCCLFPVYHSLPISQCSLQIPKLCVRRSAIVQDTQGRICIFRDGLRIAWSAICRLYGAVGDMLTELKHSNAAL